MSHSNVVDVTDVGRMACQLRSPVALGPPPNAVTSIGMRPTSTAADIDVHLGMPEDAMQRKTIDRMASFGTF